MGVRGKAIPPNIDRPIDLVSIVKKDEAADNDALFRDHNIESRPGAIEHAKNIIEDVVGLALVLEELRVNVEKVTHHDMDWIQAKLVDELENLGGNGGLPDVGHVGELEKGGLILKNDVVQLKNIQLVGVTAGGTL